jgi:hypothetical protein
MPVRRRMPARIGRLYDRITRDSPGLPERLKRFGLEPVDVVEAPVSDLLVQRPVRCELIESRDATTLPFLDDYMDGDWSIARSMQFRLLDQHRRGELPEDLSQTDYWQWHARLEQAGINARPPAMIERKIRGLIAVYESMKDGGYRYGALGSYVWALEEPLISTRYGIDHTPPGLEVYDGHHRAAAAAALGLDSLHVLLMRDVATATPFGVPLDEVRRP